MENKVLFFHSAGKKKTQQKKLQRFLSNLLRMAFLTVLIAIILFELYYLITSTSYFEIKKIRVSGNSRIDSKIILKTANVYPGMKIFKLNRKSTTDRLQSLVWVRDISVEYESFGELVISVKERKPEAILYSGRYFYEVDSDGIILTKGISNIDENLPIITGIVLSNEKYRGECIELENFKLALQWIDNLKGFILDEVSEINVKNENMVYFFTLNGVKIFPGKFEKFRSNFPIVRKELDLASKGKNDLEYIDMRNDNEVIYKPVEK